MAGCVHSKRAVKCKQTSTRSSRIRKNIMSPDPLSLFIASAVLIFGMVFLWYLKWRGVDTRAVSDPSRSSTYYEQFFLGGGRVGETLTANNNWGLCFAFANALWYYCYLGYNYGPSAILLQLPWSIAIILLGILLPIYIRASHYGTVHGFIHHNFGYRAAILAAVATIIGYTINIGFEIFYSAYLIAKSIGISEIAPVVAFVLAFFIASYCLAGGYSANVKTDRLQNGFGLFSTLVLIALLMPAFHRVSGSYFFWASSKVSFSTPPWYFVLGITIFSFFFNFVDMANWQSMAANRKLAASELPKVSRGLFVSAFLQLIAPAICGVWLGTILKTINGSLDDDAYFASALSITSGGSSHASAGIYIGIVLLGFLFITISSAGSYILAGMQTIALDIVWQKRADSSDILENHEGAVLWVKRWVTLFSLLTVAIFALMYYGLSAAGAPGVVFQFQFVMYGAAVTLFPTVAIGMYAMHRNKAMPVGETVAFYSILLGLIFVIIPFGLAVSPWGSAYLERVSKVLPFAVSVDAIANLTPVFGIVAASLVCLLAYRRKAPC